jgi:GxxExxY protein
MASVPIRTPRVNVVTGLIVTAAMKVHSLLGPGLLENTYQACLAQELRKQGLGVLTEVELPVVYDGEEIELGFRMDLVVEDVVIAEVKCVESAPSGAPRSTTLVYALEWKAGWTPDQFPRLPPAGRYQAPGGRQRLGKITATSVVPQ